MSLVEWIAAILGVLNVGLVIRRSIWNYPVGLVMVFLYVFVFYEAKLYSDVLLQIYFFFSQIYGWTVWLRHKDADNKVIVETLSAAQQGLTSAAILAIWIVLGFVMSRYTDAALPWWDASIAALSIVGQLLMAWRKIENWLVWILTNIIAIGVYYAKGLYPTVALYALLLIMAILGYVHWRRVQRAA